MQYTGTRRLCRSVVDAQASPTGTESHKAQNREVSQSLGQEARHPLDVRTITLFAFMWAVFTFFHQSRPAYWTRTPIEALQTAAAILVLFRPTHLGAFLALVLIQLADLIYTLPYITNHSLFAMFVNLTIVLAAGLHTVTRPGIPLDHTRLLRLFAPAVRIQVLVLYFFVVLHKLNWDFFNTAKSCAVDHTLHLSGLVARVVGRGVFPDSEFARIAVIAGTLAFEAAIPLLLLFRRTRVAGVALGLVFHYILGLNIYHDFSGMVFALYLLFLPIDFADRVMGKWEALRTRIRLSVPDVFGRTIPAGAWLAVTAIGILLVTKNTWRMLHPIFFGVWVLYGISALLVFGLLVYSGRNALYRGNEFRSHVALLIVPLLVFLNGIMPYLGLKTEHSFAMYSNLRTEGGTTNHLFIPVSLQIFGLQKDLVTITQSTDVYLRSFAENGTAVPYFLLHARIVSLADEGRKNIGVTYTREGLSRNVTNAEADAELTAPIPWIYRKLMLFREVDVSPPGMCRH